MKVLFVWELGSGQAHVHRLTTIARILELHGVEPVFALKSYLIKGINFSWQTVVAPPLPFSGRTQSYTFADILETFGFANHQLLRSHWQAWRTLIEEIKPRLIIADHAPGLVLAAHGLVPTIVVGGGFTVPPPIEIFPILRFPAPPESFQCQEQVSQTVHSLVKVDTPLGQLLNGDSSLIFSIPELDPYRHLRDHQQQYVSLHIAPLPNNLHCTDGSTWAYLADNYPYRELVQQTLHPQCEFRPLNEALAGKSLAIHHGGLTTSLACLLAGIPQLLLPRHLEEYLNTIALTQLGVAKTVTQLTWEELFLEQAQALKLAENASRQAENLSVWNQNFMEAISSYLKSWLY
jgi:hypothetical protein